MPANNSADPSWWARPNNSAEFSVAVNDNHGHFSLRHGRPSYYPHHPATPPHPSTHPQIHTQIHAHITPLATMPYRFLFLFLSVSFRLFSSVTFSLSPSLILNTQYFHLFTTPSSHRHMAPLTPLTLFALFQLATSPLLSGTVKWPCFMGCRPRLPLEGPFLWLECAGSHHLLQED